MQQYIINARSADPIFVVVFTFFRLAVAVAPLLVLFLDIHVCAYVNGMCMLMLSFHFCSGSSGCRFYAYSTTIVITPCHHHFYMYVYIHRDTWMYTLFINLLWLLLNGSPFVVKLNHYEAHFLVRSLTRSPARSIRTI